jgi:DNA-binding IscR family transcriptional regulator
MGVLGKSRRAKMKLDRHRAAALEAMLQAAQQEKKDLISLKSSQTRKLTNPSFWK